MQEGKREGTEGRTHVVVAPCMRKGKNEGRKEEGGEGKGRSGVGGVNLRGFITTSLGT